jgi:hypothetical protein
MEKVYLNEQAASLIRECLRKKGVTQEVFADVHLRTTFRTLQNWLSAKTPIAIEKLDVIQRYCCFSVQYLFGEIPREYLSGNGGLRQLLRRMLDIDFLLAIRKYYQSYVDWVLDCVNFHPYPTHGIFDVVEHNVGKSGKNYYCDIAVCLDSRTIPVGAEFIIGYILLVGRIRIDYGWMIVQEDYIEVGEAFTKQSIEYRVPINKERFKESGILFQIATLFGEESCTFVIHSSDVEFRVESSGRIDLDESDVLAMKGKERVVFQKSIHHNLRKK